jgi:hypothetical protein
LRTQIAVSNVDHSAILRRAASVIATDGYNASFP